MQYYPQLEAITAMNQLHQSAVKFDLVQKIEFLQAVLSRLQDELVYKQSQLAEQVENGECNQADGYRN